MNKFFIISIISVFSLLFINLGIIIKKDIEDNSKNKEELNMKIEKLYWQNTINNNKKKKKNLKKTLYQEFIKNKSSFA